MRQAIEKTVLEWKKAEIKNNEDLNQIKQALQSSHTHSVTRRFEPFHEMLQMKQQSLLLESHKKQLQFYLAFWEIIDRRFGLHPYTCVIPGIRHENWQCDLILITKDSIHTFHLLPIHMVDLKVQGDQLIAHCELTGVLLTHPETWDPASADFESLFKMTRSHSDKTFCLGHDQTRLQEIQLKLGMERIQVYEHYITPPGFQRQQELQNITISSLGYLYEQLEELVIKCKINGVKDHSPLFNYLQTYRYPYILTLLEKDREPEERDQLPDDDKPTIRGELPNPTFFEKIINWIRTLLNMKN